MTSCTKISELKTNEGEMKEIKQTKKSYIIIINDFYFKYLHFFLVLILKQKKNINTISIINNNNV